VAHDPAAARAPRDGINDALGVLVTQRGLVVTDAFQLLLRWSNDTGMSIPDVADVVVIVARREGG